MGETGKFLLDFAVKRRAGAVRAPRCRRPEADPFGDVKFLQQ